MNVSIVNKKESSFSYINKLKLFLKRITVFGSLILVTRIILRNLSSFINGKPVFLLQTGKLKMISVLVFIFIVSTFPQSASFSTGKIGVDVNDIGRLRIHVPELNNYRQIDRISVILAIDSGSVFNYMNNAESYNYSVPYVSSTSTYSDMEMIITYQMEKDFFPYFLVTLNVYGWKNASFLILKISVQNLLNRDIVANLGVEIIPQIDSEFGYERVKITETSKMIMIYKQTFLGLKYCNSKELLFANVFEWDYDYFKNDSVIYKGMTNKIIDTLYTASEKGSVITGCIRPISIPKGDSIATSLFILAGKYQYELENALRMAEKNYKILTSVKDEHVLPEEIYLKQNYPNPFNPVTKIEFSIPVETLRSTKGGTSFQNVILKVYDVLGREAATLVNEEKPPGNYEVEFNGENLPTGIYFYKLTSGEKSITRKMLLVR